MTRLTDASMQIPATFFFAGLSCAMFAASAVFFFKFWKKAREPFFLYFGLGCLILAVDSVKVLWMDPMQEAQVYFYLLRLVAFGLIIRAVVRANLAKEENQKSEAG